MRWDGVGGVAGGSGTGAFWGTSEMGLCPLPVIHDSVSAKASLSHSRPYLSPLRQDLGLIQTPNWMIHRRKGGVRVGLGVDLVGIQGGDSCVTPKGLGRLFH